MVNSNCDKFKLNLKKKQYFLFKIQIISIL